MTSNTVIYNLTVPLKRTTIYKLISDAIHIKTYIDRKQQHGTKPGPTIDPCGTHEHKRVLPYMQYTFLQHVDILKRFK